MSEEGFKKYECPVEYALDLIAGKWKVLIIWELRNTRRLSELERIIPDVTRKVLVNQLRELEADKIVHREVYPQVPPKVEYSLTEEGKNLLGLFGMLSNWASEHLGLMKNDNPVPEEKAMNSDIVSQ